MTRCRSLDNDGLEIALRIVGVGRRRGAKRIGDLHGRPWLLWVEVSVSELAFLSNEQTGIDMGRNRTGAPNGELSGLAPPYDRTADALCGMVVRGGMTGAKSNIRFIDMFDIVRFLEGVGSGAPGVDYQKIVPEYRE